MTGGSQTGTNYGSASGSGSGDMGMEMGSGSGSEALLAADGSYLAGLAMGESIKKTTLSKPILSSAMLGSAVFVVLLPFLHS